MTKNCYNLFTKHYRTHNHNFFFVFLPLHLLPSRCCLGCRIFAIAILHHDDLKKGMNLLCSSYRPRAIIHPILQIVLVQNSLRGKEINQFCLPPPQAAVTTFAFCLYPSSMLPRFQWAEPTYSVRMRCPSEIDQWASRYRGTTSKQFR